jgi:hypothetical protein
VLLLREGLLDVKNIVLHHLVPDSSSVLVRYIGIAALVDDASEHILVGEVCKDVILSLSYINPVVLCQFLNTRVRVLVDMRLMCSFVYFIFALF